MPLPATLYNERQVEIPWLFERLRAIRPPTVLDAGAADAVVGLHLTPVVYYPYEASPRHTARPNSAKDSGRIS